ncbi:MAG: MBL fold metallo-hydrolase, partial [Nitrospirota bacterium]
MGKKCVLNVDLADVWEQKGRKKLIRTIAWGDDVSVLKETSSHIEVSTTVFRQQSDGSILPESITGYIEPNKSSGVKPADVTRPLKDNEVLKVNFVDVQQGDGSVIESPDGKVILVDGGDTQMFARYLAGRFQGTTPDKPKEIECILVTHGDADHFAGLTKICESETNKEKRKRLFMQPKRVFHNGIVKGPSAINKKKVPDTELLGSTKKVDSQLFVVGLQDNLLKVADEDMNEPFRKWKQALSQYNTRKKVEIRRLQFGDNKAFDFFNSGDLRIEVLGPLVTTAGGKPALKFLGKPPKGPRVGHESLSLKEEDFKGYSASHTINGHSIVFRLVYGGFSYLFSGDLNDEASRFLAREHNRGGLNLKSEVFK